MTRTFADNMVFVDTSGSSGTGNIEVPRGHSSFGRQKAKGPSIRRSQLSTENPQSFAGSLVGFAAEREGNSWRFCCRRRLKTWSQADGFLDRRRVGSTHVYSLRPKAWYGLSIRRSVADFEKMSKRINELRLSLLSTC